MATKQLVNISREDFHRSRYWKFYSGNIDDFDEYSTLIPQYHQDYDTDPVRLIYTHYTLKNGLRMNGFLYESPPDLVRHTIFYEYTCFETWYGIIPPDQGLIILIYNMLQLKRHDVFPILWETCGKEYSGVINGFGYLKNGTQKEII